ncbi:branched-chain amino acid transport system substrate-binding protein [Nitrobacteraceae bacterium AZCC 2161]
MTKKITKSGLLSRRRLLTSVGAGAVLAASPLRVNLLQAQEATIKVGFPVPLTGPYGTEAQDQVRAAEVAIAEFNEGGGLNGRKAELLVRDDKLNPGEAATRTLELIEKEKVSFIVGSLSAAVQLAVNNVTKERQIIFNSISQSDTINEASDFSKYTFHEALNPHLTAGAVGRYAFPKFGKKVAFLTADYAYGHEMVRGFQEAGKAFGIETLVDIRHPIGTTDFSALLPRIQALKPDILCISNFGRDQQIALKQATDFGMKKSMKIIVPIMLYTGRIAAGPQAFEGVIGGTSYYWGIEDKIASAKAFNDRFRKMHGGKVPSDYGALGYGGVKTLLMGAKAANSLEADKVIAAIEALKYDYYKGPEYYRKCDHQSVQSVLIIESKASPQKGDADVFNVVETEAPNDANLRSCEVLGHKA